MRETNLVNLYFTEAEVMEALELWCQHNHTAFTSHFRRKAFMEWARNKFTDRMELLVSFDGEVPRPE